MDSTSFHWWVSLPSLLNLIESRGSVPDPVKLGYERKTFSMHVKIDDFKMVILTITERLLICIDCFLLSLEHSFWLQRPRWCESAKEQCWEVRRIRQARTIWDGNLRDRSSSQKRWQCESGGRTKPLGDPVPHQTHVLLRLSHHLTIKRLMCQSTTSKGGESRTCRSRGCQFSKRALTRYIWYIFWKNTICPAPLPPPYGPMFF